MAEHTFEEEILIPKARIAILVGKAGSVRKQIAKKGNVKLFVDKEGTVKIIAKDAFELMIAKNVVEAIGRGFNPEVAQKLFKEDNSYELLSLQDFGAKNKKSVQRLKGLVIGKQGTAKHIIQKYTGTDISVYGKTIGIIGPVEGVQLARQAFEMILTGAKHATAYRFLERQTKHGK